MLREEIISKGAYSHPQSTDLVSVKQYITMRKNGKRYLLLRLQNDRAETVTAVTYSVKFYDAKGAVIGQERVEEKGLRVKAGEVFAPRRKIRMRDRCADFYVTVCSVRCGNYVYTLRDGGVRVGFEKVGEAEKVDVDRLSRKTGGEARRITPKALRAPRAMLVLSCALLLAFFVFCGVQLAIFMSTEVCFTLDSVDYAFETDDHVSGPIRITGYNGDASNIVIPAEIEGHAIARIEAGAFRNSKFRSVEIEGATVIEASAFENSRSLKSLSAPQSPEIGNRAFAGCTALQEVELGDALKKVGSYAFDSCSKLTSLDLHGSLESLGEYAFRNCGKLESLILPDSLLTVGEGILSECLSLQSLTLPRLGDKTGGAKSFETLFDGMPPKSLKSLTVTRSDQVKQGMLNGGEFLEEIVFSTPVTQIDSYAFMGCVSLKTFALTDHLQMLSRGAFAGCEGLESISIPETITEIPEEAFESCYSLELVELPKTLKRLGKNAFYNCRSLKSLVLPAGMTSIHDTALIGCVGIEDLTLPFLGTSPAATSKLADLFGGGPVKSLKSLTILSATALPDHAMSGFEGLQNVVLPQQLEEIGDFAFSDCKALQSVNLPRELQEIGVSAFSGCRSLIEAQLPAAITEIPENLFYNCRSLRAVSFSEELSAVGKKAFYGCEALEQIVLPDSVSHVGEAAFAYCKGLKSVILPSSLARLENETFRNCASLKELTLPNTLKQIGTRAFSNCLALTSLNLPNGLESIGTEAFSACSALQNVALPAAIGRVEKAIFADCTSLSSLTVPYIGSNPQDAQVLAYLFSTGGSAMDVPSSLREVTVTSAESLATGVFLNCSALTRVTLPATLTALPQNTFRGCTGLQSVTLPTGLQQIGSSAFQSCAALTGITLPETLQTIGMSAFMGCRSLSSITLPESLTSIGTMAFQGCSGLREITVPFLGLNAQASSPAFYQIFGSTVGTVPSSLKKITVTGSQPLSQSAFANLINVTEIHLSQEITSISQFAFSGCKALTDVTLSEDLETIERRAFYNCSALKEILIPDGVKTVGDEAFSGCSSLQSIELPASLNNLGSYVLKGCDSLQSLTIPVVGGLQNGSSNGELTLRASFGDRVPTSLKKVTVSAMREIPSNAFSGCDMIEEIVLQGTEIIGERAFGSCYALKSVELPDTLTEIERRAFDGCEALTSLHIPNSVQALGSSILDGCYTLRELTVPFVGTDRDSTNRFAILFDGYQPPQSLRKLTVTDTERLPDYAFLNASYLREIHLPESLQTIGNAAFTYCTMLRSLTIPESVTEIGEDAFEGCYCLFELTNNSTLDLTGEAGQTTAALDYALAIRQNGESFTKVTVDGFVFLLADDASWYLIDYTGSATDLRLPASFDHGNRVISSYRIPAYAFYENSDIKSVQISSAVNSIGASAFENCISLERLTFASNSRLTAIPARAFANTAITAAVLPATVTSIGDAAFECCYSLGSVTLPTSVRSIGENAFYGCETLFEVYNLTPLSLTVGSTEHGYVAYYALIVHTSASAEALQDVSVNGLNFKKSGSMWVLMSYDGTARTLNLSTFTYNGSPVTSYRIYKNAFYNNNMLQSVTIDGAVSSIGAYAFAECMSLQSVTFVNTGTNPSRLTALEDGLFEYCRNLTTVVLPNTLISIGEGCFRNCRALTDLTLPATLRTLEEYCFYGCRALTRVELPQGLTTVPSHVFQNCSSIVTVVVPQSVTQIMSNAFTGCSSLLEVYNLSALQIQTGSSAHGSIGYYALVIHDSLDDTMELLSVRKQDGIEFFFAKLNGTWILYRSDLSDLRGQILELPTLTVDGTAQRYEIHRNGISTLYSFNQIMIPKEVSRIDRDLLENLTGYTVYYGGTLAEWNALVGSFSQIGTPLLYAPCVHDELHWTYINGEISTEISETECEITVITPSTCSVKGVGLYRCKTCNATWRGELPLAPHQIGTDGICSVCHINARIAVTQQNFATCPYLLNESTTPFAIDATGKITSANHAAASSSTLEIYAINAMTVSFTYSVSSESGFDTLQIRKESTPLASASGLNFTPTALTVELEAGERLVITYSKDRSGSAGEDCATITDLVITLR